MTRSPVALAILVSLVGSMAGCVSLPTPSDNIRRVPEAWGAPFSHGGRAAAVVDWWQQFDDATLGALVRAAEADNPTLDAALASIESAKATVTSSRSAAWPAVDASGTITRGTAQGQAQTGSGDVRTERSATAAASWELDLFGKTRHTVAAAERRVEARIDDWHAARVSVAAEVATDYIDYRACQLLVGVYDREVDSRAQTSTMVGVSADAGLSSPADRSLASASLASTRSAQIDAAAQCDLLVKAMVNLTGMPEPELRDLLGQRLDRLPEPAALAVDGLPANVLRQRPDIASAEQELAAAGAEVGVARADLFPSLSLSGSITVSTGAIAGAGNQETWSVGPSLSIPLFDRGRRRAAVRSAIARFQAAEATYERAVRDAVEEIEDALVRLDAAARRNSEAERAAEEYRRYFTAIEVNWKAGGESLLTLEEARRTALNSETELITVQRERIRQWISLYRAVGGGWDPAQGEESSSTASKSESGEQVAFSVRDEK